MSRRLKIENAIKGLIADKEAALLKAEEEFQKERELRSQEKRNVKRLAASAHLGARDGETEKTPRRVVTGGLDFGPSATLTAPVPYACAVCFATTSGGGSGSASSSFSSSSTANYTNFAAHQHGGVGNETRISNSAGSSSTLTTTTTPSRPLRVCPARLHRYCDKHWKTSRCDCEPSSGNSNCSASTTAETTIDKQFCREIPPATVTDTEKLHLKLKRPHDSVTTTNSFPYCAVCCKAPVAAGNFFCQNCFTVGYCSEGHMRQHVNHLHVFGLECLEEQFGRFEELVGDSSDHMNSSGNYSTNINTKGNMFKRFPMLRFPTCEELQGTFAAKKMYYELSRDDRASRGRRTTRAAATAEGQDADGNHGGTKNPGQLLWEALLHRVKIEAEAAVEQDDEGADAGRAPGLAAHHEERDPVPHDQEKKGADHGAAVGAGNKKRLTKTHSRMDEEKENQLAILHSGPGRSRKRKKKRQRTILDELPRFEIPKTTLTSGHLLPVHDSSASTKTLRQQQTSEEKQLSSSTSWTTFLLNTGWITLGLRKGEWGTLMHALSEVFLFLQLREVLFDRGSGSSSKRSRNKLPGGINSANPAAEDSDSEFDYDEAMLSERQVFVEEDERFSPESKGGATQTSRRGGTTTAQEGKASISKSKAAIIQPRRQERDTPEPVVVKKSQVEVTDGKTLKDLLDKANKIPTTDGFFAEKKKPIGLLSFVGDKANAGSTAGRFDDDVGPSSTLSSVLAENNASPAGELQADVSPSSRVKDTFEILDAYPVAPGPTALAPGAANGNYKPTLPPPTPFNVVFLHAELENTDMLQFLREKWTLFLSMLCFGNDGDSEDAAGSTSHVGKNLKLELTFCVPENLHFDCSSEMFSKDSLQIYRGSTTIAASTGKQAEAPDDLHAPAPLANEDVRDVVQGLIVNQQALAQQQLQPPITPAQLQEVEDQKILLPETARDPGPGTLLEEKITHALPHHCTSSLRYRLFPQTVKFEHEFFNSRTDLFVFVGGGFFQHKDQMANVDNVNASSTAAPASSDGATTTAGGGEATGGRTNNAREVDHGLVQPQPQDTTTDDPLLELDLRHFFDTVLRKSSKKRKKSDQQQFVNSWKKFGITSKPGTKLLLVNRKRKLVERNLEFCLKTLNRERDQLLDDDEVFATAPWAKQEGDTLLGNAGRKKTAWEILLPVTENAGFASPLYLHADYEREWRWFAVLVRGKEKRNYNYRS
ncbi:unnamed protein product [Amoebophrya sp. A120]|nr:unnamed protein product [Amoebophrya sp. A120]|eukprot:GSA120T00014059001.1